MKKTAKGANAPAEVKPVKFLAKEVGTGLNGAGVTFALGNGQVLAASLADFSDGIVRQLALHGLAQKVGDAAAGCAVDRAYGAAFAAMAQVVENLKAGRWNSGREATGGDLAQAIANLKGLDLATVQDAVRAASEEQRKAWLKNAAIDREIKAIRLARAEAAVKDSDEDFDFEV